MFIVYQQVTSLLKNVNTNDNFKAKSYQKCYGLQQSNVTDAHNA